ncbi:MAG: ribbon-helix-helix protein, CopG family [Polyangiaceae bacterium]|nr:ribbon-helix-helix protein, CopG family [Polyangiaceae bacterium]MCE7893994.1 ribbon-helix-helix protein, CopG family [Sorangiineae bacterium PRO1]
MTTVTKLAISLPAATAKSLEKVRAKKRLSRNAAIAEAVEQWVAAQQMADADRKYVEGYLCTPEGPEETAATAKGATTSWAPWE